MQSSYTKRSCDSFARVIDKPQPHHEEAAYATNIRDRGTLAENKAADIMVFDWHTVKDNNTEIKTAETPSGIDYVFINGTLALDRGNIDTLARPGVVI